MRKPFEIDRLMSKSLTKQICDGYRSAIVEGRLAGGDRFPTCREICDEFDVSMIVSSAVVRQLGREGLIRSRPHTGSIVVPRGSTAWRGTVLFVNAGGTFSANVGIVASMLREKLASSGFLFVSIDMPSRFIGRADVSRLTAALASRPKLVVLLHARPQVVATVAKAGVDYIVLYGDAKSSSQEMPGSCRGVISCDYRAVISDFAAHCRDAGVRRVLEVRFSKDDPSAMSALRKAGVEVSTLKIRETPDFCFCGYVQRAGLAAAEKLLAKGKGALPDLVYFNDDYLAAGALVSFARHGVRFPDDVRFVSLATKGFEPVWWQELTRIEWDWFAQGEWVARRAIDFLESRTECVDAKISPTYIVGDTFPRPNENLKTNTRRTKQ